MSSGYDRALSGKSQPALLHADNQLINHSLQVGSTEQAPLGTLVIDAYLLVPMVMSSKSSTLLRLSNEVNVGLSFA